MAQARRSEAWEHTSWLLAMIANANRDTKKRPTPFRPSDFNPCPAGAGDGRPKLPKVGVDVLKAVFVDKQRSKDHGPRHD
jgi:hypothetical protein